MFHTFARFFRSLIQILFPDVCVSCGAWGTLLCDGCHSQLVLSHSACERRLCPVCGKIATDGIHLCESCARYHHIDGLISVYESPTDLVLDVIHAFKYKRLFRLAALFTDDLVRRFVWLPETVQKQVNGACLIPVPLYWKRRFWRWQNQSLVWCRHIAQRFDCTISDKIVRRNRSTRQQARLDRTQRQKNVSEAFVLQRAVPVGTILLIDDVWTSGSTLSAVARVLRAWSQDTGQKIYALVLLRK